MCFLEDNNEIKLACCLRKLSLLLAYRGANTQVTDECLKNLLVSSSCVAITPACIQNSPSRYGTIADSFHYQISIL